MEKKDRTSNTYFFDTLIINAQKDCKAAEGWILAMGAAGFLVAAISLYLGQLTGVLLFGFLGVLMVVVFLSREKTVRKLKAGASGDLSFFHTYGLEASKMWLVEKLNEDHQNGKLLYCQNDEKLRTFIFPQLLVYSRGADITAIAEDKLYWAYLTVHKKNGAERDRIITFFTEKEEVTLNVAKREDAQNLIHALARNFGMMVGFDNNLRQLYDRDREEFVRRMDEFKLRGKETGDNSVQY